MTELKGKKDVASNNKFTLIMSNIGRRSSNRNMLVKWRFNGYFHLELILVVT